VDGAWCRCTECACRTAGDRCRDPGGGVAGTARPHHRWVLDRLQVGFVICGGGGVGAGNDGGRDSLDNSTTATHPLLVYTVVRV
jgi:hypothetical protein